MTALAPQALQQDTAPGAWSLYFDAEEYVKEDRRAQLISEMVAYFRGQSAREVLLSRTFFPQEGTCIVALPLDFLLEACGSGDLEAAIDCQPLEGLCCLAAAAYEVRN